MHYGELKKVDVANGPGTRVSLFVSGCRRHCKDCFNSETWEFTYGKPFTKDAEQRILDALAPAYIHGLTVLGGEPFEPENQVDLLPFLQRVRKAYPNKSIWCFTGYILESDILPEGGQARCEVTDALLRQLDVLVDGPFIAAQRNLMLRFRGSENQRLIDMKKTLETGTVVLWED